MIDFFQTLNISRFVFVDAENANNPKAFIDFCEKHEYLNLNTQLICFIGANQNQNTWYTNTVKHIQTLKNQYSFNLTPIRIPTQGENAVDMVLASYAGLVMGQNNRAVFIIVSNDNDYTSVIEHFGNLGIQIHREKIELDNQKTKKLASNVKSKRLEDGISNLLQSVLKIEKKKRPCSMSALKNILKNSNRKKIREKDIDSYTSKIVEQLKKQKKIIVNKQKIQWK